MKKYSTDYKHDKKLLKFLFRLNFEADNRLVTFSDIKNYIKKKRPRFTNRYISKKKNSKFQGCSCLETDNNSKAFSRFVLLRKTLPISYPQQVRNPSFNHKSRISITGKIP